MPWQEAPTDEEQRQPALPVGTGKYTVSEAIDHIGEPCLRELDVWLSTVCYVTPITVSNPFKSL